MIRAAGRRSPPPPTPQHRRHPAVPPSPRASAAPSSPAAACCASGATHPLGTGASTALHKRRGSVDRTSATQPQRGPRYRAYTHFSPFLRPSATTPHLLRSPRLHTRSDLTHGEQALTGRSERPRGGANAHGFIKQGVPRLRYGARIARSIMQVTSSYPEPPPPPGQTQQSHADVTKPRQHEPTHAPPVRGTRSALRRIGCSLR